MSGVPDTNIRSQPNEGSQLFLWYLLTVLLIFLNVKEVYQLILHRQAYIVSPENWLEISLIIATFISCSGVVDRMEMKLHSSAVALLLGWFKLLAMLGRLPPLSVKLEMLLAVSSIFFTYLAAYFVLLRAFALCFYIISKASLQEDGTEMFSKPQLLILKAIIMFTGEFEISNLPFDNLPYTSHLIFLLFVAAVTIILFKLNGLAVRDTDAIWKNAETVSLVARVTLVSRIEELFRLLPSWMTPMELREEQCVLYPNRRNAIGFTELRSVLGIISKKRQAKRKWEATVT
jgi:hypothetical protein